MAIERRRGGVRGDRAISVDDRAPPDDVPSGDVTSKNGGDGRPPALLQMGGTARLMFEATASFAEAWRSAAA